jgi:Peptidase family M23
VVPASAAAAVGDAAAGRAAGLAPGTAFSAFAASVLTRPAPVRGTDGAFHLVYELVLTNTTPITVGIEGLRVGSGRTHRTLLSLSGTALTANAEPLGGAPAASEGGAVENPTAPATTVAVGGSQSVIVWLDVRVRRWADVPVVLEHGVVGSTIPAPGGHALSITGPLIRVTTLRRHAVVLGQPLGPGLWYASESCCTHGHHRAGSISVNGRFAVPQRFAIDFYRVDTRHRSWLGDPTRLRSYLSYGQPILAAAGGTVVDAQVRLPDSHPPQPPPIPPIKNTVGNHVTVRIAPGLYLLYGHMKPGSVRVHTGQRVRRGQTLGLIGTSGNSTTPHLHFQALTTPTFFPTDSPPYVFDRFDLVGQITQRIWDDNLGLQPTNVLPYVPATHPGPRRDELPLDRNVIRFGVAG